MNNTLYFIGIRLMGFLQRLGLISDAITAFSRVWLRQQKLRSFLRAHHFDAVLDGGANVGEFASLVRSVSPKVHLICVEPHAPSAAVLRQQGFEVVEAALWKEKTRLSLSQPTEATTSCTVMESATSQQTWEVEAVRLQDLPVTGQRIFIKLDLQGAELAALEGMGPLWERCAALMLEVSLGANGNFHALDAVLTEKGFREYSTANELEVAGRVVEADKIYVRTE